MTHMTGRYTVVHGSMPGVLPGSMSGVLPGSMAAGLAGQQPTLSAVVPQPQHHNNSQLHHFQHSEVRKLPICLICKL